MPSIEIICVGQVAPAAVPVVSFAVECERERISHRGPWSLFQSDFDRLDGWIYHPGNPELRGNGNDRFFFAFKLLSAMSRTGDPASLLEFADEHRGGVRVLLAHLLSVSSLKQLLFTSDWQFGPPEPRRFPPLTLNEFWHRHDQRSLRLNAAYTIAGM